MKSKTNIFHPSGNLHSNGWEMWTDKTVNQSIRQEQQEPLVPPLLSPSLLPSSLWHPPLHTNICFLPILVTLSEGLCFVVFFLWSGDHAYSHIEQAGERASAKTQSTPDQNQCLNTPASWPFRWDNSEACFTLLSWKTERFSNGQRSNWIFSQGKARCCLVTLGALFIL